MSKYGFNENEVRKTIVDMIDKDGFHKETVYDGKYEPGTVSSFSADGFSFPGESQDDAVNYVHDLIAINVSDNNCIYLSVHETDTEYELNVGDVMPTDGIFSILHGSNFPNIAAFYGQNFYEAEHWVSSFYYNLYLVNVNSLRIEERTKCVIKIDE